MKPQINPEATVAYLAASSVVVTTKKPSYPTTPLVKTTGSGAVSMWGEDNLFPQNVVTAASKTFIPSVIDWQVRALGTNLIYGIENVDEVTGKETFIRKKDPKVEDFLRRSNISRYIREGASDFYWFGNVMPEMVLSNDRTEIASICIQEASYCRWQVQNPKSGLVEKCFINANWDNGGTAENSVQVPVVDPYYDPVGNLKARTDGFKYIYPLSVPSPGRSYYQLTPWDSVRKNGWLEIASLIPVWKKALMKNQISIKYHIEIPEHYFKWKYRNWDEMSQDEQITTRKTEIGEFNDFMMGEEKAGKTIITTSRFDPATNTKYPGWVINTLDDKLADGKYIEDSQEASSQLLFALSVDGTLIGSLPGKGLGAGSGSDKRVAYNMYIEMQQANEDIILEPLHLIRDYNGWNSEYKFKLKRNQIATLDKGNETKPIQ